MKKKSSKTKAKGKVSIKDLTVKSVKGGGVKGGIKMNLDKSWSR